MSSSLEATLSTLIMLWRDHEISIRRPANQIEISLAAVRLGRPLPPEAAVLYRRVDGMAESEAEFPITPRLIRIWPLAELRLATWNDSAQFSGSILFADYLLHSHEYGLTDGGTVVVTAGHASHIVASSLHAFLQGYAADDPNVFR